MTTTTSFLSIDRPYVWLFVALPLFVPSLFVPMSSDNSIYQSMAYDLLEFGKMPYLGSWDQNFPGIVAIHAVVIAIFGGSDLAFRIFDVLYQLAFCALLFRTLRLYGGSVWAGLAVLLYAQYYGRNDYMFFGQRELFAHGFALLAIWYRHKERDHSIIAGCFYGIAALTKPTVAIVALPLILVLPVARRLDLRAFAKLALGGMIPNALIVLIYSFFPGGVTELYLATIRYNMDVYSHGVASVWATLLTSRRHAFMYPLALIGVFMLLRQAGSTRVRIVYAVTIILAFVMIMMQSRLLIYHYSTLFLLLAPLPAIVLERLYHLLRLRPLYLGIASILFVALLTGRRPAIQAYVSNMGSVGALDSAYEATDAQSQSRPKDVDAVVAYLARSPESRVEVMSNHARLRDKLRRNSATRFTLMHPIGLYTGPTASPIFTEYQERWQQEFLDSLDAVRPEFIVIARNTVCLQLYDPWETVLKPLPGFAPWFAENYRPDTTIANFEIYRRID